MKYSLPKDTELTPMIISKLLQRNKTDLARLEKLENYYKGKTVILNRTQSDETKPNNRIVNPYANYITSVLTAYFVGEPISYHSVDEDCDNELNAILQYNDIAALDYSLARDCSIFGKAYELHYIDSNGSHRITKISPHDMIIVYDDSIEADILYAIRVIPHYDVMANRFTYKVEVYTDTDVKVYNASDSLTDVRLINETPHHFGMVPVVEYLNNEEEMGDFEVVIPLIDAYDTLTSDALNDFSYFVDSYLLLRGMVADAEDIKQMKENRVILLDDTDANAEWLIKSENDTISENMKNRFNDEIHKFSSTPDLNDVNFAANASGIAIKYKMFGTETLAAVKERYFKKGLQRRLELIFNILDLFGSKYDYLSVELQFTRNLPTNETEIADVVNKLSGIVSTETLLAQIPFIDDVAAEMEKREADKKNNPFYDLSVEDVLKDDEE